MMDGVLIKKELVCKSVLRWCVFVLPVCISMCGCISVQGMLVIVFLVLLQSDMFPYVYASVSKCICLPTCADQCAWVCVSASSSAGELLES